MGEAQSSPRGAILVRVLAAIVGLAVLLALGIHLAPIRSLVLRSVLPLAGRADLIVRAESLDYNLFRLRATVRGVTVAASHSPDAPFFDAQAVTVIAPPGVLRGIFSLTRIEILGGRVTILRTAAGANLPSSSSTSTSEPAPLRLGHVTGDLVIDIRDEIAAYRIDLPRVSVDLSAGGGQLTSGAGRIGLRGQTINVTSLAGGAAFDGRMVSLRGMNLASDVANARIDGTLTVLSRQPAMDLALTGGGSVARLTALATPTRVFDGDVTFEGKVVGPIATPVVDMRVRSARLTRDKLALTDVDLVTHVDTQRADITQSTFGLAGGRVNAAAQVTFDGTSSRVEGTWTNVDVPTLITALVDMPPALLPAGPMSGTVMSDGAGFDLTRWTTAGNVKVGAATTVRDRLAMPGQSQFRIRGGAWRLDGSHRVGDVAPLGFMLNGTIRPNGRVPVAGGFELGATQVPALASVLTRVGLADLPPSFLTAGSATAAGMVDGELSALRLNGATLLEGVRGDGFALGPARVAFDAAPLTGDVQLDAHADSAEVAGQPVAAVDASAHIHDAVVDLSSFSAAESMTADPAARGTLRGSGRYLINSKAYELQAEVSNWLVTPTTGVPAKGLANGTFTGSGTIDRPAGDAQATLTDAFYANTALGTITATAALDGEQATVNVAVPTLNTTGRAVAALRAPYAATADVAVQALDLAVLRPLVARKDITLQGSATATAHAEGELSTWQNANATVNLVAAEGLLGDLTVALDGPAQIIYGAGTVSTVRLGARAGGLQAEVRGSLPIDASPTSAAALTMTLMGDVGDLVTAARATKLVDVPVLSGNGPLAVNARVDGAIRAPIITADVDLGPASLSAPDLPTFERVRLLGHVEGGRADIQELFAVVDGAELTATASAPLAWASTSLPLPPGASSMGTLSARLKNVTAALLGRLATGAAVPDLAGSIDATVELSSATPQVSSITGEARIDRLAVSATGIPVTQAMPTRIVLQDGFARVASWDWTGEGSTLTVAGQVRLANLQAGILANGVIDLRLLSPFLRSSGLATAGTLTPRLSITGPLNRPRIDGDITLADADVRLTEPRVFISDLNGRANFSRDSLQIGSFAGSINGGDLKVGGGLSFAEGNPLTAGLTVGITGMALEYPEGLRTELDGDLLLDIVPNVDETRRIPRLSGSLHVLNGSYRQNITVVGGLLGALQSRANAVPVSSSGASGPEMVLDVTVITDEDIVVDNNAATVALAADVRIIGTVAQPALSGRAEVMEGGRVLLGRNTYQVTSGTLDFANPTRIDPDLNLQLTTRVGSDSIDVTVTGTASAPMLALTSDNPDLAQSDLTALLLTGRTLDKLGTADAEVVGTVLIGNLSGEVGQVLGLAGRVVGIDTIRLGGIDSTGLRSDPAAIATETDPTSRLTFTKSLGSNVDVTFSQSLRQGDEQTWVVEYLPSRRLLARLISNDNNLRTYEFRHDVQFGSSSLARAQTTAKRIPGRIGEITIAGELPGQNVRRLLKLEVGDRFDFQALQDDRERLERFYREQGYLTVRIGARQTPMGEMVTIAFTIQPGSLTRIDVVGMPLPKDILDGVAQVWADSIAGPLLVDEARTLVADRLADQGYLQAKVDVTFADMDGVQVLTISAEQGPRTSEVVVEIDGVSDDLKDDLSDRLSVEKLVPLAPRDPQAISNSLQQALRDQGYMQPRVAVESPVFTGEMAVVTVHVQSGDQVLLGPVTVTGSTLPAERVQAALDLTEGLSYLQAAVDNAQSRLTSFYRQEGYPTARVVLQTIPQESEGVIAVSVRVTEGPRQTISSLRVDGLRKIKQSVAQRAMNIQAGQPARAEDLLRARTRLFATGLFRRVDVTSMDASDSATNATPSSDQVPVEVIATVEEWPAVRFRYGFQLAEERPEEEGRRELVPGISADVTRRTVFGRAINVGGAMVLQRRDRLGRIFVTAPTLFARSIRSSLILQKEREEFAGDNVADSTQISWEQRTKIFSRLDLSYSYKFERLHSFVDLPPDPNFPPFDISLNVARLTTSAAWDSRNEISAPIRGSFYSLSFEESPTWSGSDIRFIRFFGQARHFQAVRKTVFASSFQYGIVNPLGGQEVIPTERFYTGGGTSIRGLQDDGAGPRGVLGPSGGRVMIVLNQEARVPLFRWIQGVAFVDAGNVFTTPAEASFSKLTTSIGAGLRVVTPFAMLRVDYGHIVLNGPVNGIQSRWSFGIGHAF